MAEQPKYTFSDLEDNASIKAEYLGYKDGLVRSNPGDWTMLPSTAAMVPEYMDMEVRASDVWIVTYPKCGTTWTQELIWQVVNGVDLERGKESLDARFPFLEFDTLVDIPKTAPYRNRKEKLDDVPDDQRRFIKSHLPLSLLPPDLVNTAKVIYVVRNPKDVLVSFYHHHKLINGHGYVGDLPSFAKRFMRNEIMFGPFFPHADEAWALKDNPNLLILFYEDMKKDLGSVIDRVSQFLESPLTKEQVDSLVEHLDIKNMRNNKAINPTEELKSIGQMSGDGNFIRKGEVGGWKKEFADFPEIEKELYKWVEQHVAATPVPYRM